MAQLTVTANLSIDGSNASVSVISPNERSLRLGRGFFRTLKLYGDPCRNGSSTALPAAMSQGGGLVSAVLMGTDYFDVPSLVALVCVSRFARGLLARSKEVQRNILNAFANLDAWQPHSRSAVGNNRPPMPLHFIRLVCVRSQAAAAWHAYERRSRHWSSFRLPRSPPAPTAEAAMLGWDLPDSAIAVWSVCDGMSPGAFSGAEVPGFGGRLLSLGESLELMTPRPPGGQAASQAASQVACNAPSTCRALFLPITSAFGGRRMWLSRASGAVHIGPSEPPCTSGSYFAALTPGQQAAAIFGRPKHSSMISLLRQAAGLVT